jgi:hypothetical protein
MENETNIKDIPADAELLRLRRDVQDLQDVVDTSVDSTSKDDGNEWPSLGYSEVGNSVPVPNSRFRITKTGVAEVTVLAGSWTRGGYLVSAADTIIGSLTTGPYYITATLADAASPTGKDQGVIPQRLLVTAESDAPASDNFNKATLIGIVTCAADVITNISQRWVGDIDDTVFLPDSAHKTTSVFNSLTFLTNATVQEKEATLFGFESSKNYNVPCMVEEYGGKSLDWEWIVTVDSALPALPVDMKAVESATIHMSGAKKGKFLLSVRTWTVGVEGRIDFDSTMTDVEVLSNDGTPVSFGENIKDLALDLDHDTDFDGVPGSVAHLNYFVNSNVTGDRDEYGGSYGQNFCTSIGVNKIYDHGASPTKRIDFTTTPIELVGDWKVSDDGGGTGSLTINKQLNVDDIYNKAGTGQAIVVDSRTLVTTDGDWSVSVANQFLVLNTETADPCSGISTGALRVSGGIYGADNIYIVNDFECPAGKGLIVNGIRVATDQQTIAEYTTDPETSAYTGYETGEAGTRAKLSDLNYLRLAYENLRASFDDLRTQAIAFGWAKVFTP